MSGITQPLPQHLQELMNNMDLIGLVPKNHKILIKDRTYTPKNSWTGPIYRWLAGESYVHTCMVVGRLTNEFVQAIVHEKNSEIKDMLMTRGLEYRQGIMNLIGTYADIPDAVTQLRTSLAILDLKIPDEVKKRHGILYPSGNRTSQPDITPGDEDYDSINTV
jgi:hypothetical protein